jgi:hypothetical protein
MKSDSLLDLSYSGYKASKKRMIIHTKRPTNSLLNYIQTTGVYGSTAVGS